MARKHTPGRSPLAPDPDEAGSYYRRVQDIERALSRMQVDAMPTVAQYIALYFACEKLRGMIIGIASKGKDRPTGALELMDAVARLGLSFPADDLAWIFGKHVDVKALASPASTVNRPAREVRNNLAHTLGPTHVEHVEQHAAFHVPKMRAFLKLAPAVLSYLDTHYAHLK